MDKQIEVIEQVQDAPVIGVSDLIELPVEALELVGGGAGNAAIDF